MSRLTNTPSYQDPLTWLRDSVQARVISRLFSDRVSGIVLKGGLAMRLAHGSSRLTKDIDLDADKDMPMNAVQDLILRALKKASAEILVNVEITSPKQTDTTMRWKIAGQDPESGSVLHLTVEVSHRKKIKEELTRKMELVAGQPQIIIYKDEVLAFNKVCALLANTRSAPRDIADLHMLIKSHVKPPIKLLKEWLETRDKLNTTVDVWSKVSEMSPERFEQEVRPSLCPNSKNSAIFDDWSSVQISVAEAVSKWIDQASKTEQESCCGSRKVSAP